MWDDEENSYYESEEWATERELVLAKWDGFCEECGEMTESPHVHHIFGLNYREYMVLCPECHAENHVNDEISNYGKDYPRCKDCGRICYWEKIDNKWRLTDSNGNIHVCKHLKDEAKNISESLNKSKKKIQKSLF